MTTIQKSRLPDSSAFAAADPYRAEMRLRSAYGFLFFAAAYSIYSARDLTLDDTFITLRYALHWEQGQGLSYNVGHVTHGASSLVYAAVLGSIGHFFSVATWPAIAKFVSVLAHMAAIGAMIAIRPDRPVVVALLIAVPSSARWLEDGMETSLCVLAAIGAAWAAERWREHAARPILTAFALAAPALLRIDLLPVTLAGVGWSWAMKRRDVRAGAIAVTMVAAVAILTIVWTGSLLPDTALAKRTGHVDIMWPINFVRAMASTSPLWLLLPLALLWRPDAGTVFGLLPIAAIMAAGSWNGQFIHGARYFLPALAFAATVYLLRKREERSWMAVATAVLALAHAVVVARPLATVMSPVEMTVPSDLVSSEATIGVYDIGRIGWETHAQIVDFSALVHGREAAGLPIEDRPCRLMRSIGFPRAIVLSDWQPMPECAEGLYVDRHLVVMRAANLDTPLVWRLWEKGELNPK